MSKKILFLVFVIVGLVGAYFAKDYFRDRLDIYKADLSMPNKVDNLGKFFIKHDRDSVYVELLLTDKQNIEFNTSSKDTPIFHLQSLSNDKFEYIFHLREDGKKEFIYDDKSGELKAIFMPHIQKSEENKTIINLLPLTPNDVKKIK